MSDWLTARTKHVILWHAVTSFAVRLRFFSKAHQESKQMSTRKDASWPWTLITGKGLKMYLKEVKLLHSWERHLISKFPEGLCTYDPPPPNRGTWSCSPCLRAGELARGFLSSPVRPWHGPQLCTWSPFPFPGFLSGFPSARLFPVCSAGRDGGPKFPS